MQAELQDLKSVFKLHFELGGEPLVAEIGRDDGLSVKTIFWI